MSINVQGAAQQGGLHTYLISTYREGQFRAHPTLLTELEELVRPSYVEAGVLAEDLVRCDTLYTLATGDSLVAFFLVRFLTLEVEGTNNPAMFMGLSAAAEAAKNSQQVRELYMHSIRDGLRFQAEARTTVILFATLATPSSFNAVHSLWAAAQPLWDGSFDTARVGEAQAAAAWLGAETSVGHPFVLPAFAKSTRYSETERLRIASICERKNFRLFANLGIEERRGDRLLMTFRLP